MASNIAKEFKYNIVVGFSTASGFVRSLADVISACVAKGHDSSRMLQDIRRCTSHHPELFGLTPHALYTLILSDVLRRG